MKRTLCVRSLLVGIFTVVAILAPGVLPANDDPNAPQAKSELKPAVAQGEPAALYTAHMQALAGRDFAIDPRAFDNPQQAATIHLLIAIRSVADKQQDKALDQFNKSIARHATPEGYFFRAMVHQEQGHLVLAYDDLSAALKQKPDWNDALCVRGNCLMLLGRLDEAKSDFDQVLKSQPNNTTALLSRAKLSLRRGDFSACCDDCRQAIAAGQKASHEGFNRTLDPVTGKTKVSFTIASTSIKKKPRANETKALSLMLWSQLFAGDYTAAADTWLRSAKLTAAVNAGGRSKNLRR